jgi:type I protein arginine methyltransferase
MYTAHFHGRMIADRIRVGAYRRALEDVVRPGDVVVDIGSGTGVLAVLACQFGARKVYAIECDEIIELARQIAKDNGCQDRIEFIRDLSTRVELPEKANVVVADLHGALPVYCGCIEALIDARRRFLAAGGAMIPRTEHIWIAVADLPETTYAERIEVWTDRRWGVDLTAGRRFGTDWDLTVDVAQSQLVTQSACVATLNYHNLQSSSFSSQVELKPIRDGNAKGYAVWFDAELADGISFTTAPGSPRTVYSNVFLPWSHPVAIQMADRISATICLNSVKAGAIWRWDTSVEGAGVREVKAQFRQSNFNTQFVSADALHKRASNYRPRLNQTGTIGRILFELMDGSRLQSDLAEMIRDRFPETFRSEDEAFQMVTEFTERYGE